MVWELKIGEGNFNYSYFSPQLDSYTLIADIPSGFSAFYTFTTTIQPGNSCATTGKVWTLASFTGGNETATAVSESNHGVGAKLTGTVRNSSGNPVNNAQVNISPADYTGGSTTTNSSGYYELNGLDCTYSHNVTVTAGGESGEKTIYSSTSENSPSLCNGDSVNVDIPTSSTPTATTVPEATATSAPTATTAPASPIPPPLLQVKLHPNTSTCPDDWGSADSIPTTPAKAGDTIPLALCFRNANNFNPPGSSASIPNINLTWTIPTDLVPQDTVLKPDGTEDTSCTVSGQTVTCDNLYSEGMQANGSVDGRIVGTTNFNS